MGIAHQLAGAEKDLGGGFKVRRLLPDARQRRVGPFVFFDHFGPVTEVPGVDHDVRPHPHIGLATVTYLFEGAMVHRDSLGTEQRIEPGAINWMNAGRGIVHSERRPADLKDRSYVTHGLQMWVGLPAAREEDEPSFAHTPADAIPQVRVGRGQARVMVGDAFGVHSPVVPASPTTFIDLMLPAGEGVDLPSLAPELALFVVEGEIDASGDAVAARHMAVLQPGAPVRIEARTDARLVIVGGDPLDGHRHMWWNFVHSRADRIRQAAEDWEAGRYPRVPGETESIPLPDKRFVVPASGPSPQYL